MNHYSPHLFWGDTYMVGSDAATPEATSPGVVAMSAPEPASSVGHAGRREDARVETEAEKVFAGDMARDGPASHWAGLRPLPQSRSDARQRRLPGTSVSRNAATWRTPLPHSLHPCSPPRWSGSRLV